MPWRNGLYVRLQSWAARAAAGAPISATEFDADGNDEASALDNCLLRDGTGLPTADLPMAGHGLTGMRQGAAPGEAVEWQQWQDKLLSGGGAQNRLQNSSLVVNQRGVSGTVTLAAGAYGHDRWKAGASGCTYNFAASGPNVQITITSGSLLQIVNGSEIEGGLYTLSQLGSAQGRVYQGSTTGYAPTPFTTPGLNAGTATTVEFTAGSVLCPQLEPGGSAHAYVRRPLAVELLLCQNYYERVNYAVAADAAYATPQFWFPYKATKIATPTATLTSQSASNTTPVIIPIMADGFGMRLPTSSNFVTASGYVAVSCEP